MHFDIWAHHPYTSGGPTHKAVNREDVSIGDLPGMKRLLDAAVRAHHVVSKQKVRFWVTEFAWDSQPADPKGVPARLNARWVSEALYRMWLNGVSLVTWIQLRDEPFTTDTFCQCGLWLARHRRARNRQAEALITGVPFSFRGVHPHGRHDVVLGPDARLEALGPGDRAELDSWWVRVSSVRSGANGIFAGVLDRPPIEDCDDARTGCRE